MTIAGKKVGFAVIGLGKIAEGSVLPAFRNCKKAKLVAVVSRDKAKAARFARRFKASHHYQNEEFDACLDNPAVSGVFIATPNGEHADFAIRAADAGKCKARLPQDGGIKRMSEIDLGVSIPHDV